jgi:hypothetical protein
MVTALKIANESEHAQQLTVNRPPNWAYLLTIELLHSKLAPINKQFNALKRGSAFMPVRRVNEKETIGWLICKIQDLKNLIPHLQGTISNDLNVAWGREGKLADPVAILESVETICEGARHLLEWEKEVRFTLLPTQVGHIQNTLCGTTIQFLEEINSLVNQLEAPFQKKNPVGKYKITVEFKDPPNIAKLLRQLSVLEKDIERNPQNWIGWF